MEMERTGEAGDPPLRMVTEGAAGWKTRILGKGNLITRGTEGQGSFRSGNWRLSGSNHAYQWEMSS